MFQRSHTTEETAERPRIMPALTGRSSGGNRSGSLNACKGWHFSPRGDAAKKASSFRGAPRDLLLHSKRRRLGEWVRCYCYWSASRYEVASVLPRLSFFYGARPAANTNGHDDYPRKRRTRGVKEVMSAFSLWASLHRGPLRGSTFAKGKEEHPDTGC